MTDDELRSMMREWRAPPAPESLRGRVLPERPSWWRRFWAAELRVPAPVAVALLGLVAFGAVRLLQQPSQPSGVSLTDFEHVKQLQPRIVRTVHESN